MTPCSHSRTNTSFSSSTLINTSYCWGIPTNSILPIFTSTRGIQHSGPIHWSINNINSKVLSNHRMRHKKNYCIINPKTIRNNSNQTRTKPTNNSIYSYNDSRSIQSPPIHCSWQTNQHPRSLTRLTMIWKFNNTITNYFISNTNLQYSSMWSPIHIRILL